MSLVSLGLALMILTTGWTGSALAEDTGNDAPPSLDPGTSLSRSTVIAMLGLGALAALSSDALDDSHDISRFLEGSSLDGPIDVADLYGEGSMLGAAALSFMAIGRASGNPSLAAVGDDLSTSLLAAWAMTWSIKLTVNADRPNGGSYSFPSGHTATAFAAAPVFYRHFGPVVGCSSYALAALTGLARMEDQKHYLADTLVGAAIGILAGNLFTRDGHLNWAPPRNTPGIGLSYRF